MRYGKVLGSMLAGGLLLALPGCSTRQVLEVALSKNPEQAVRALAQQRVQQYKYNPELILADFKRAKAEYDRLMGNVRKESSARWGKREADVLPDRTRFVKYSEQYRNRVVVDYDSGRILIEHLDEPGAAGKLQRAAAIALLTPGDPGAVDLFSDREVDLNGRPYLQDLVLDQNGAVLKTRADVERYAGYLVGNRLQRRSIDANGTQKQVLFVQMDMVNSHLDKRALQYADIVRNYAAATGVGRSLIFAVIKTESAFNPYAVSSAPAYGMMQLVPSSGGREAYRKLKGADGMPSKEYLFDANNNIELGATYLGVLLNDSPLRAVRDPVAREYCAIAAYNTGPGNVFRAFSQAKNGRARQSEALDKINALRPDQVFATLKSSLPYAETRGYVVKVNEAKRRYAMM